MLFVLPNFAYDSLFPKCKQTAVAAQSSRQLFRIRSVRLAGQLSSKKKLMLN